MVGCTRGEEHHRVVVVAGHKERRAGSLENMRLMVFGNAKSGFGMGHTAVCPLPPLNLYCPDLKNMMHLHKHWK